MIAKRKMNEIEELMRSGKQFKTEDNKDKFPINENSGFSPEMSEWEGETVDE